MITKQRGVIIAFTFLVGRPFVAIAQEAVPEKETKQYEPIDGAVIYDHDPSTRLGDNIFGTIIADLENDAPGRCSHGGPVCMEYMNGNIVAFYINTSDHNSDGWSEYAVSKDGGRTWDKYNKLPYSFEAYARDQKRPVFVEEGLVTEKGTVVLYFETGREGGDGYSQNCIINQYDDNVPNELMTVYSIIYQGRDTNEYVFFIKLDREASRK